MEIEVTLALGANIGDPVEQLRAALRHLRGMLTFTAISDVYVTEPVGIREQPDFHNLVVCGTTAATVYALQAEVHRIEARVGRVRRERNGPRAIDIDLLTFGDLVLTSAALVLPHPRLHERAFVLGPLVSIDPGWRHPRSGRTAVDLLEALEHPSDISHWGPLPFEIEDVSE